MGNTSIKPFEFEGKFLILRQYERDEIQVVEDFVNLKVNPFTREVSNSRFEYLDRYLTCGNFSDLKRRGVEVCRLVDDELHIYFRDDPNFRVVYLREVCKK